VKNRNPLFFLSAFVLFFLVAFTSCKKINEATELGSELIPAVDNINTFADTLDVETYNELFTELQDTIPIDEQTLHYLGHIGNDPFFGKTSASIFLQLKPSTYTYSFPENDAIAIDSVVLVLNYRDLYGDSTLQQRVNVFEITQSSEFRYDSNYLIRSNSFTTGRQLGSKAFFPKDLNDSIKGFREAAANQLRIPLNNSFGQELLNNNGTNAYISDSAFNKYFKGFAIVPEDMGNAVMGFALPDTNTKLAIYFKYTKSGKDSTLVRNFNFTASSASANLVKRDYTGSPLGSAVGSVQDDFGYIQNTPGSYVRVKVPELATLSNRVIHRAELIVQQVYDPLDALFTSSPFLFVDALIPDNDNNPDNDKYKAIPYDFAFNSDGSVNLEGLGGVATKGFSGANSINIWRLNLTRYFQNVVNKKETATDLRLYSPYYADFRYEQTATPGNVIRPINLFTTKYRVRVAGGNHPTQRMRVRIIYSNIP
jgi:hypothetical protein